MTVVKKGELTVGRPIPNWHGFVGQQEAVTSAKRLIAGCLASSQPFPNTLLAGTSGIGKTHLAEAIAKEYGTKLHYILCGKEVSRIQICETLLKLEHGDFLFLDEVHGLRKHCQEILYPAIDKSITYKVDRTGRFPVLTDEWVGIKPFTLFAATDRPGELRNALRRRLPQTYTLFSYDERELREIVSHRAAQVNVLLTPQAVGELARVCRGTPRNIRHLLQRLGMYFPHAKDGALGQRQVRDFLKGEGIDESGLNQNDRAYLKTLFQRDNKPTSLASLAISIGHDEEFLQTEIEGFLVRMGLVSVDRGGRSLTDKGLEVAKKGLQ